VLAGVVIVKGAEFFMETTTTRPRFLLRAMTSVLTAASFLVVLVSGVRRRRGKACLAPTKTNGPESLLAYGEVLSGPGRTT
jgi:hypothetical protein